MYTITGSIEGVAPILFNRFTGESLHSQAGKKTRERYEAEALEKVYRDDAGLFLPAYNLKRAIAQGCQSAGLKDGRKSLAPMVTAAVFPHRDPRFDATTHDYIHETTGRHPPRTGGAVIVFRPALKTGWKLTFGLDVFTDRLQPESLLMSLEHAGLLVGIGDWRPEYGRFVVRDWDVSK